MGETADQLRREVDQKRDDAAQKIDQIETLVTETTQQVKDQVKGSVDQTTQKVKDTFDFRRQVEERPLVALGAAVAGGFVLGGILGGGEQGGGRGGGNFRYVEGQRVPSYQGNVVSSQQSRQMQGGGGGGLTSAIRNAAKSSGFDDTLNTMAAAFMGTLTERMRSSVDKNFPGVMEKFQQLQGTEGSFTEKAQAAVKSSLSSADADSGPSQTSRSSGSQSQGSAGTAGSQSYAASDLGSPTV